MTIEEKCNKLIIKWNNMGPKYRIDMSLIENWEWTIPYKMKRHKSNLTRQVQEEVRSADSSECLTSNCEYIRECKKWYMERK